MNERFKLLYNGYLANTLTAEELSEFLLSLHHPENENLVSRLMDETWNGMFETIAAPVIPIYRRKIFKWIAAACIVLVTGYGLWVTVGHRSQVTGDKTQVAKTNDIPAPSNTRAVITLADGSKVYLDSANNGTIAQENNVNIVKNNEGGISYMSPAGGGDLSAIPNNKRPGVDYNTLFNPRGSKVISLTLSDGTKVWLNSESSLKYPIAFNSNTREVQITGEAYFEVKHNSKQPFKVHLPNGSIVEDIGTAFNVNAYADEADIKTTLIEGSVRVSANGEQGTANSQILKPGEQVSIHDSRFTIDHPDVDEVMAWKNGMFSFESADVQSIMRVLARWYDLDVVYEGKQMNEQLHLEANRNTSLQNVLKVLEMTSKMRFKIEGKKVTVMK